MKQKIELGRTYVDKLSGFEGIAAAYTEYLNGCVRVGLQGKVTKDGVIPDYQWVDDQQLIELSPEAVEVKRKETGGPGPTPGSFQTP